MRPSLPATLDQLADALAPEGASAETLFRAVADALIAHTEAILVTVSAFDADFASERLFTTHPEVYPISGRKPVNQTPWTQWVMVEHKTYIANDYETMAETMFDHETIRALGCESIVNLPIVFKGRAIGTLNVLAKAGNFTEDKLEFLRAMRLPILAALLVRA